MKEEIKLFFKGDIENDLETLKKYSRDASIFEIRPKLVVFPKDSEDVKNLVKWVNQKKSDFKNSPKSDFYNLSITARSAGTDMSGGPLSESLIMDFTKYMNKFISSDLNSLEPNITVQPGMFYTDFEKIVSEKGLMMPSYPASKSICAMGGIVANNSGGEKTLVYGKTEDYVIGLKIILSDGNEYEIKSLSKDGLEKKIAQNNFEGEIYKKIKSLITNHYSLIKKAKPNVSKNSAGYYIWNIEQADNKFDLNKLIVGSQGTLGIITEITFKLVKEKPYSRLLVMFLKKTDILPSLVNQVLKSKPETLESYDDKTLLMVFKYIWSFAKLLGVKNLFKLLWSFLPESKIILTHGFPKLIILAEFTGETEKEVTMIAKEAVENVKIIKGVFTRLTHGEFEAKKYWTIRRQAFNLIRYHLKKEKSMPFIDDVIVRPEKMADFFSAVYKILNEYKDKMTFALGGHSGDGNMHIYTLMDPRNSLVKDIVLEVSERVYSLVVKYGGSITAEHNDGIIRTPYLEKMYGKEIIEIFQQIKDIFDPQNIYNPGKKVGGTKKDIAKYIMKSS